MKMNMTFIYSIRKLLHNTSKNTLLQKTIKKQDKIRFKFDPTLLEFMGVEKKERYLEEHNFSLI
jgi:hypothetical protein